MKCEYQVVSRSTDAPMSKAELNTMGLDDWQMVSAIVTDLVIIYYFIRAAVTTSGTTASASVKL